MDATLSFSSLKNFTSSVTNIYFCWSVKVHSHGAWSSDHIPGPVFFSVYLNFNPFGWNRNCNIGQSLRTNSWGKYRSVNCQQRVGSMVEWLNLNLEILGSNLGHCHWALRIPSCDYRTNNCNAEIGASLHITCLKYEVLHIGKLDFRT